MMQVQDVKNEGLQRSFTITVPENEMEKAIAAKLQEIAKTAKIQGFRPGKVPMTIITQRYGDQARAEVMESTVDTCVQKALDERKLRPAMQPRVELADSKGTKDLVFNLSLEVLPEITPTDFSKLSFVRKVADVSEDKIVDAINRLAKNMRQPEDITESRAVKMGDVAVIDFDGTVDGERRPGMKSEDHAIELGTKSFIDTFEEQIVGMKVGDEKDINVTFPEAYHAKELAGKKAVFAVKLKAIRAHKPIEINEDLAKELGVDSVEELRTRITDFVGQDYKNVSRMVLKRNLMDALADKHSFEVPQAMMEAEFNNIWHQLMEEKKAGNMSEEDSKKSEDELKKEYRDIAERRIRLGLLLSHVAEANKIEVTSEEMRKALIQETSRYPGQEKAVFDYYMKNRTAIEHLRAPILEEKIVDFILAQTSITEEKMDPEALMKLPEEMDD